jgi:demethylmenaquinone methyltransferase/2-methoxy-6-polyprenyl-1,4-benzoquinol methylase
MTDSYYVSGPDRATRVQHLFARIAPRYDLINDLQSLGLHRRWKKQLAAAARLLPGVRALDVCCGTGDIAAELAKSGAEVTGCDFSREMLEAAGKTGGIPLIQGDAMRLPFRDESFHVVTIGYGLRNLADFDAGLRELLRVLRPGGRLLILDFGKPPNALWRAVYFAYLRAVVPLFGLIFCGDAAAYAYILESLKRYPAQEGVAERLRHAGCTDVRVKNWIGGVMSMHTAVKADVDLLRQSDDVSLETRNLVRER